MLAHSSMKALLLSPLGIVSTNRDAVVVGLKANSYLS